MKRLVFASLWIVIGLVCLEATAWALLRATPALRDRAALAAAGADTGERGRAAARIGHRFRGGFLEEAIHPFLGFVVVPDAAAPPDSLAAYGLPWSDGRVRAPDADTVVVGLFGGSVATFFADGGGVGRIAEQLADLPAFAGKRVETVVGAHIGYKQPQSVAALAWLQALGVRFDVVILLDGYNEAVVPFIEHVPAGVFPFFPGHWHQRVASLETDVVMRERIGEIAFRKARRTRAAAARQDSAIASSRLVELAWALWDQREERAIEALRARADVASADAGRDYAARGPQTPHRDADALAAELARFWAESSRQMRALTEARGGRFFHFLQPNQHVPGSKPIGEAEAAVALRGGEAFSGHVVRGYRHLRERGVELAAEGVRFHDLSGVFAEVTAPLYVDNIGHIGKRGNALLADAMAAAIRRDLEASR